MNMDRYLIIRSSDNSVETVDSLESFDLNEMCLEVEFIDLQKGLFYRPSGWLEIIKG